MVDDFVVVTMLLGNKFYTVGKPVCFPNNGARKWQKMLLWVAHMKNKKNPKSQIFTFQIYCQEQLLQQRNDWSNTNILTFCAKFIIIVTYNHIFLIFLYKYNWIQQNFKHVIVSCFFLKHQNSSDSGHGYGTSVGVQRFLALEHWRRILRATCPILVDSDLELVECVH